MKAISTVAASMLLQQANRLLFLTHSRPDGDTLGSAYGLAHALPGKEITIVNDDTPGERLEFLCEGFPLTPYAKVQGDFDLIVAIDVADEALLGEYRTKLPRQIDLKIDHHAMGKDYAVHGVVDCSAAACGEIIYEIVCHLGKLDLPCANCLYGAISSDTGSFRYSNTTPRTHQIVADLLRVGCNHADIDHRLYESHTRQEVKAMKLAWENLTFLREGKIAVVTVSNAQKEAEGLNDADLGVINSMPREISGVELGIVIKQSKKHPEEFKVSLRSNETVHANEICARFGGGGHARAAGGSVCASSVEEALGKVMGAVEDVWHD